MRTEGFDDEVMFEFARNLVQSCCKIRSDEIGWSYYACDAARLIMTTEFVR